jgi:hypothetical protein
MKNRYAKKTRLSIVLGVAWILSMGASAALAGEITGNGKSLKNDDGTLNGKSQCAFSGRQDNYEEDEGVFMNMLVQSWGQATPEMKEFFISIGLHPGLACNPRRSQ